LNRLIAKVKEITHLDRINLIKFDLNSQIINVLILEMNVELKRNKKASLLIKPTAITIVKNPIDFENILKGKIIEMERGDILARISVDVEGFEMEVIMLNEKLNAKVNDEVYLVFKASDVIIAEVLND
jgi:molybdopterin-binding protein